MQKLHRLRAEELQYDLRVRLYVQSVRFWSNRVHRGELRRSEGAKLPDLIGQSSSLHAQLRCAALISQFLEHSLPHSPGVIAFECKSVLDFILIPRVDELVGRRMN